MCMYWYCNTNLFFYYYYIYFVLTYDTLIFAQNKFPFSTHRLAYLRHELASHGAKQGLDSIVHAETHRLLPSESSSTHRDRRGKTSITLIFSRAIFKMPLYNRAIMHYTTPSCSESITLYLFSLVSTSADEIDPNASTFEHGHIHSA